MAPHRFADHGDRDGEHVDDFEIAPELGIQASSSTKRPG
jgi:hypothetical protein